MENTKKFGERVRELREAKARTDPAFTVRRFAQTMELSPSYISMLERGEVNPPKAENIRKMAELLGCSADELFALANKVNPEIASIIMEHPEVVPNLLRTVRDMPSAQVKQVLDFAEYQKNKKQ
ncbi:helix-turn-helix transcriptional regulator [uncultured Desulfovibrio sp.]|uniref:helix-turn-helix domain-containing protein n=1 Tax=uncultured Desulfovibrio sp. TaxID=167968 RepID=UPI0020467D5C|nr:helix-turn-helix transcriptional regulator [uncultured Desulfovibrio sp.]DAV75444.1 MAG TPA: helix-turn-helix domain protein [Caudoviricetes sp.]